MKAYANIKFDFRQNTKSLREMGCSNREIKVELTDMIRSGEFFPEDVIDCEVTFDE